MHIYRFEVSEYGTEATVLAESLEAARQSLLDSIEEIKDEQHRAIHRGIIERMLAGDDYTVKEYFSHRPIFTEVGI